MEPKCHRCESEITGNIFSVTLSVLEKTGGNDHMYTQRSNMCRYCALRMEEYYSDG